MIRERHISRAHTSRTEEKWRRGKGEKICSVHDGGGGGGVKITSIPEVIIALRDRNYAGVRQQI